MRGHTQSVHTTCQHRFILATNTGGRAENGTLWTRATAPHNTTVVSTQCDFNMVRTTFAQSFVVEISRCFSYRNSRAGVLSLACRG